MLLQQRAAAVPDTAVSPHLLKLDGHSHHRHTMIGSLVHAVHAAVRHKHTRVGMAQYILHTAAEEHTAAGHTTCGQTPNSAAAHKGSCKGERQQAQQQQTILLSEHSQSTYMGCAAAEQKLSLPTQG